MGFDNERIIDIHVYPGEYFCPLCRILVDPNEALQSQCTHIWCKPCLAQIAKNTRACPYDGFLITEADSKPLFESNKALAESIGTVKVRCLYHRSGCTWEGPLCECSSHWSGCAFGNSPVICDRCGIQLLHRQVHDHAQTCPGVYQVQQAADTAQVVSSSGLNATTGVTNQNQATSQAGALISWTQNSQSAPAPLLPGLDSKQQADAYSQTPAAVPFVAPTAEQWYQLKYQQYTGYDSHQQAYPYHYPYQQLAVQQYQQHLPQAYGQPQIQVYAQVQAQSSSQPQNPVQPQSQPQPPAQTQTVQFQTKTQTQVQPHGAALFQSHVQPLSQNLNQAQVNPQQVLLPAMQSHAQNPSQTYSIHGLPASQTQQYNQPHLQPHFHPMQPQVNYQPHLQMLHPQPSVVHLQAHMLTQSQLHPQPQSQIQPQPHLQPYLQPTQPNHPAAPSAQPPSVHTSGNAVSAHQSYLLTQPPQQQPASAYFDSGSLPSGQMQGHVLPQPSLVHTPSQGPVCNQQLALFPSLGQASMMPPAQQQQFHPQTPQLSRPNQQHPVIHSSQQSVPQQYVQQQPFSGFVEGQLSHHSHLAQQQSQLCLQGSPHMMWQSSNANVQLQQNVAVASGLQPQQPKNCVVRPVTPNQGAPTQQQPSANSSSGFVAGAHISHGAQHFRATSNQLQTTSDQQLLQSGMASTSGVLLRQGDNVFGKRSVGYETGLPSQNAAVKVANASSVDSVELKPLKSDIGLSYEQETTRESTEKSGKSKSLARDAGKELHGGIDGTDQPVGKLRLKVERIGYSSGHSSDINSSEVAKHGDTIGDVRTENLEFHKNRKAIFIKSADEDLQSNIGPDNQPKSAGPPIFPSVAPLGLPPHAEVPEYPTASVRPQGSGLLSQPRQVLNPNEQFQSPLLRQPHDIPSEGFPVLGSMASSGKGPTPFGAPQGPPLTTVPPGSADHRGGTMQTLPQHGPEDQFGMQGSVNSLKSEVEPNALQKDGGPGQDNSLLGSQDERYKALPGEHLNLFIKEVNWPRDQGSRSVDGAPLGLTHGAGLTLDSAGGSHTSRVLLPLQPPGGPGMVKRADLSGQDIPTSHLCRGKLLGYGNTPSHYGTFPGHARMGEMSGPANLPHKLHHGEPSADSKPGLPQLGESGCSSFLLQEFPNNGPYAGDMSKFNNSRKRKHLSMGWCCICKVDCETVGGLNIHSQTREHKQMSMDIVVGIKQQNDKKSTASYDRAGCEGGSKKRNSGPDGRGKKP